MITGKIIGTGSCLPKEIWDNDRLSQMVETSDEWIRERTGIRQRHIATGEETTVSLAVGAARAALENAGVSAEEIDLLIVATVSPDELFPATSCRVQEAIGAVNATCFDLNAACTGFLFALNTAQAYISQGIYRTALLVGAERLSNLTNWEDRTTCILFGDGAGAAVVRAEEDAPEETDNAGNPPLAAATEIPGGTCGMGVRGRYAQATHSAGAKGGALTCASRNQTKYAGAAAPETYLQMDGRAVFKFAITKVPEVILELAEREQIDLAEVKYFVLHQANERIIQGILKKLKTKICAPAEEEIPDTVLSEEEYEARFPMNIQETGNTSSASIPILLDQLNRAGKLRRGDKIILAGFGAGLSYGASYMVW